MHHIHEELLSLDGATEISTFRLSVVTSDLQEMH